MKLIKNTGSDRVIEELRSSILPGAAMDMATSSISLHAFGELSKALVNIESCRLVLPEKIDLTASLLGGDNERAFRNKLGSRALAIRFAKWLQSKVDARSTPKTLPQSFIGLKPAFPG